MSATYDPTLPAVLDQVRNAAQDVPGADGAWIQEYVDPDTKLPATTAVTSDETITALIAQHGVRETAARCADAIAGYFSQQETLLQSTGEGELQYGPARVASFKQLAKDIRAGVVWVGSPPAVQFAPPSQGPGIGDRRLGCSPCGNRMVW